MSASPKPLARRPRYRAARAFYLTLFIGTCLATYSLLSHTHSEHLLPPTSALHARSLGPPLSALDDDDRCRLVHRAEDQCAFVRQNCPDDEGGFTAYLDLYYCKLPHFRVVAFIILFSWLGLLFSTIGIAASDFFCINLSTIAGILGMSESMAGVTFLAFGNGSPDVFSTFAAMSTHSGSLAVGELFGAAGFITAVVAGSMALIRPFAVAKKSFIRDVGFFTVAAAFSMVFLWDGRLHFWECAAMVAYYLFYVAFVVVWHWWLGRRRRRREKEAAARGHFIAPGDENELEEEPYHDDPDEAPRGPSLTRAVSQEDWNALERGSAEPYENDQHEDYEEEARDRWMSELASNMRLTRPTARARRNTVTPVRPSLVGALEFQAVLKSLQKSRNIQTIPLDSRRYSDDPTYTTLQQQQEHLSTTSDPAGMTAYEVHVTEEADSSHERSHADMLTPYSAPAGRVRAVSANDAAGLGVDSYFQRLSPIQSEDNLMNVREEDGENQRRRPLLDLPDSRSPSLRIEPATPRREAPISDVRSVRSRASTANSGDLLVPPNAVPFNRPTSSYPSSTSQPHSETGSLKDTPRAVPSARGLPKIVIPRHERSPGSSRSTSPMPAYRDYPSPSLASSTRSPVNSGPPSLSPPGPLASPESLPPMHAAEQETPRRPTRLTKLWPHSILPPPGVIIATLLPTIYHWHEKTWYEKILGIVAAPSVFLLSITLPVVEGEKDNHEDSPVSTPAKNLSMETGRSKSSGALPTLSTTTPKAHVSEHWLASDEAHPHHGIVTDGVTGKGNTASVATHAEQNRHNFGNSAPRTPVITPEPQGMQDFPDGADDKLPELWNRWLTIIQLFLAPNFIVFSIYIQSPTDLPPSWLITPILICLLVSAVLLIPLLWTTTPTHRPSGYRTILSMAGFVVSIAWISAVASQVVGALKALAVILNMSHAIMGLTIFAVGNSLGDLVADVTVAKLGYPVMALSACFGGPMLNILLGVGLSGSYILVRGAERRHDKHPDKGIRFKTYHIEVSKTLIVSGLTLLVTLVGLLIAVPLNRWVLDRKIGWSLIALWTMSTIFNVVIEVTGILGGVESS
ncbi:cation exchanger [Lecanosticta acicola]|uniref:Cation exchanger n=1 Tax=Lecanosticta acicola TaxID=111012 RepID=A0AAI8YYM1_9PEZI|nr:cation exchanger [Lecanosticta acicola]